MLPNAPSKDPVVKKTDIEEKQRAMAPPNAAPPETPMIYGSAKGFLRMVCNAAPVAANAAPTVRPKRTRDKRSSNDWDWGQKFWW